MATPESIIASSLATDFSNEMLTALHRDVLDAQVSWMDCRKCLAARIAETTAGWNSEHVKTANRAYMELGYGDALASRSDSTRHARLLPLVVAEIERRRAK